MIKAEEPNRRLREEAAQFQARLSAFGEVLAAHPYATDRPDATRETITGYARALDAYEAAKREASRDRALARQELDAAVAALNHVNAYIAGTVLPETPSLKLEAHAQESRQRAKPRFRDRHTKGALAGYAGLVVLAVYGPTVFIVGGWPAVGVTVLCLIGLPLAVSGGVLGQEALGHLKSVRGGKLVVAEYSRTAKSSSGYESYPWEQHYLYVAADGEQVTYRRAVSKESLAAVPTRRFWLSRGEESELHSLGWVMVGLPLFVILSGILCLTGTTAVLAAVPGVLLYGLTGHHFG